jgi:chemotaxis protein methyltransferase CheR
MFPGFKTASFQGVMGYQRSAPAQKSAQREDVRRSTDLCAPSPVPEARAPEPGSRSGSPVAKTPAERARRLADAGSLAAALECCDRAIEDDRLNPAHHYMRALIMRERGEREVAAGDLRRALFLDPAFVMAHFTLGHVRLDEGRLQEARSHFAAARHYASRLPAEEGVPYSDDVNAGRFVQLVAAILARLADTHGVGSG